MLNGWKAIAGYLGREERTAMRWANERGLPVHRAPGPGRGTVYALPAEIDAWLAAAREAPSAAGSVAGLPAPPAPAGRVRRWLWPAGGTAVALLALAALVAMPRSIAGRAQGSDAIADPAARATYLQATYDWNLRTRDGLTRAVREYGDAIARDPRAAPAYVGLANSYLLLREFGAMADGDAYARADAAAQAAVALAPDSAAAHRALAFVAFWWRQDRPTARHEFLRALALDPTDALTHHWYATALSANGEQQAALREIGRARDLAPAATPLVADQGLLTYLAGDHAAGMAMLRAVAHDQPDAVGPHRALADIALWEGRPAEYLREQAATAALRGDTAAATRVAKLATGGATLSTLDTEMLGQARARARARGGGAWFQLARIASLSGQRTEAEAALARACAAHETPAVAARGDLWLSRSLSRARIAALCGDGSLQ